MMDIRISNNVEDYADCVGQVLRNRFMAVIGEIAEVTTYVMNGYGYKRAVFILTDGRRAFVDETTLAKKMYNASEPKCPIKVRNNSTVAESSNDSVNNLFIGKNIYRDGSYVGTIASRSYDDDGHYYAVYCGNSFVMKIHFTPESGEDTFIDEDEIIGTAETEDEVVVDVIIDGKE